MSQFTSGFWDVYIAVITVVSIVACAVVLKSQSVRRKPGPADTTGHVWDEDLREYNNPLPRWWSWLFYITVVFGLGYLVLYPGLGSWSGLLGWSQITQLESERELAAKRYGPIYDRFAAADVQTLIKNPEALAVGQKLFLNTCAQCHASDGAGSRGFPNLTDQDWQWGGDAKTVEQTITGGRTAAMPPWGAVLGEQGVKDAAHYVRSLSGLTNDSIRRARGEALFKANCIACHGSEGKGNPAMGAPNLADATWLYGSSESTIIETVTRGRNGQMPAHKGVLTEAKIHLLTAYVLSLSQAR
ncbi:MAG: cytochrome-c oxidase, cbb3-type subunit III [Betaproteobacteria bacterium]|nr:MAG: cytochrome-c oxidase, cbb3-type subunit III [Betaproteobacteria bacterium]